MSSGTLTVPGPDEIRRRLQSAQGHVSWRSSRGQHAIPIGMRGDHDLNPDLKTTEPLVPASVLVPLILRPEGITVLLTKRTDHLSAHAGQISFPGGRFETDDADAAATALRETEEEVGLARDRVEIVGRLDTYIVRTRFEVTPVVGMVMPPFDLAPDEFEVAAVFEVPLAFILDPGNHQRRSRIDRGIERQFWAFSHGDHLIWGATAGMLMNLYEVLKA